MASRAEIISSSEVLERWRHMAVAFNRLRIPCDLVSYLALAKGLTVMAQAPDGGFALPTQTDFVDEDIGAHWAS